MVCQPIDRARAFECWFNWIASHPKSEGRESFGCSRIDDIESEVAEDNRNLSGDALETRELFTRLQ